MKVIPHFLIAGEDKLAKRLPLFKQIVRLTLTRVLPLLNSSNEVDLVFSVNPQATIPEYGIGGYTPNAHNIFISLDPKHPKFISSLKIELPRTLAHELHHTIRWIDPGYGQTLGEALVTEGLAANFELEVFKGKPNMWDVAVQGKKLQQLQARATRELHSSKYNHNDWFFGSERRHIPRWTGYALGYRIVHEYLRNDPKLKPSRLVAVQASEVLS
jgi:uncharacterized protein YjaZ